MADSTPSTSMKKKLEGKVGIITGGASGIGEATALHFATHGARAIVIADIQDEKGEKLAASIGPGLCKYVRCDVSKEDRIKALVQATIQLYGQLDIMFCNAGIINKSEQKILDLDLDLYDQLFAINVRGMAACVKHSARAMVEGKVKGSIICTASAEENIEKEEYTDYTMSKQAVVGLVRCASRQLGKQGVRVNCVSPGTIETPMLLDKLGIGIDEVERLFERNFSLGGMLKVNHVADAVVFLASDESEFITGHNLAVDGGYKD
ncbi:adh_short_C2 domain-containing protein [Cephalotus follicularis]|uniref:Adh_short_C2 domain-containing protein n=1 Tax=Cephalotus follicularis TaxID=3775 RepID=A0A1Q3CS56_CEPFO|nr:adh_short_C2 domain-containing protein [Cephalotus follicularis]